MLTTDQVIAYIGANAAKYNLDPAALLAVAQGEGLGTKPGSTWTVPGEAYPSFGPASWFSDPGAAGGEFMKAFGVTSAAAASVIAWSPQGLDYWMQTAANAKGVAGQSGLTAITNLVTQFERPSAKYVSGNITNAKDAYESFRTQIASLLGQVPTQPGITDTQPQQGNPIVPVPADSGGTTSPGTTGSTTTSPGTGGAANPQDIRLGDIGPFKVGIPSGLVLGIMGMGLLALGIVLFVAQAGANKLGVKVDPVGVTTRQMRR
jgi:hypothetical protein